MFEHSGIAWQIIEKCLGLAGQVFGNLARFFKSLERGIGEFALRFVLAYCLTKLIGG